MDITLFIIGVVVFFIVPGLLIVDRIGVQLHGLAKFNIGIITGIIAS